jgi:hypothetical protein
VHGLLKIAIIATTCDVAYRKDFLSYLLVRRLQEKMSTIYCQNAEFAHVFTNDGVRKVQLKNGRRIPELLHSSRCCALVNLGTRTQTAPIQFRGKDRVGGVVVAAPYPEHVALFEEHLPSTYYMPTSRWNWDDLYCARRVLQRQLKDLYCTQPFPQSSSI